MKIDYLTPEEITKIHDEIIKRSGGSEGVINKGYLDFISAKMRSTKDIF